MDFINAITHYSFLQNAIAASVLASLLCGISGTFVYFNRITFIAGGIAHAVLGGVGIAVYFGFSPFSGAIFSALFFSITLTVIKYKATQHEDTVIGALWSLGMSLGIIFIYCTPGYSVNLLSYLFGNILLVSKSDLLVLSILTLFVISVVTIFYRQFKTVGFDIEFSELRGVKIFLIYGLMLSMIAVTIVVLMKVVGLILVIAFLSLPSATAAGFTKKMGLTIVLSSILSLTFSFSGLFLSYEYNLPAGAVITLVAGTAYLLSIFLVDRK